jgi:hypothetical protein
MCFNGSAVLRHGQVGERPIRGLGQEAQFSVIVLAAKALDVAVVSGQDIFRCFGVMCLTLPIVVRISRTCV